MKALPFSFYYAFLIIPISWIAQSFALVLKPGYHLLLAYCIALAAPGLAFYILRNMGDSYPQACKEISNDRFILYSISIPAILIILSGIFWPQFTDISFIESVKNINSTIIAGRYTKIIEFKWAFEVIVGFPTAFLLFYFSELGWSAQMYCEMSQNRNERVIIALLGFMRGCHFLPSVIGIGFVYLKVDLKTTVLCVFLWLMYNIVTMFLSIRIYINSGRIIYSTVFRIALYLSAIAFFLLPESSAASSIWGLAPFSVCGLSVMTLICVINEIIISTYGKKERIKRAAFIYLQDIVDIYKTTEFGNPFARQDNSFPKRKEIMKLIKEKRMYIFKKGSYTEAVLTVNYDKDPEKCEICDINVSYELQCNGVGRRFLKEAENELKKHGIKTVRARIISVNAPAYRILFLGDYIAVFEEQINGSIYTTYEKHL